jgi:class 3 adenylate cyclase
MRKPNLAKVTALQCELIGAARGGRVVDLEDLRELVDGFRRRVLEAAERHQGFV